MMYSAQVLNCGMRVSGAPQEKSSVMVSYRQAKVKHIDSAIGLVIALRLCQLGLIIFKIVWFSSSSGAHKATVNMTFQENIFLHQHCY